MRRTAIFTLFSFLLFACNSNITNNNISDLESLQLKSSFFDLEENNLDLSEFNDGKVVVSYWATWCAPCIKEMPSIKRAEEILEDYGYTFLLVSDETIDKISNFKNEMNFDLKFLNYELKVNQWLLLLSSLIIAFFYFVAIPTVIRSRLTTDTSAMTSFVGNKVVLKEIIRNSQALVSFNEIDFVVEIDDSNLFDSCNCLLVDGLSP